MSNTSLMTLGIEQLAAHPLYTKLGTPKPTLARIGNAISGRESSIVAVRAISPASESQTGLKTYEVLQGITSYHLAGQSKSKTVLAVELKLTDEEAANIVLNELTADPVMAAEALQDVMDGEEWSVSELARQYGVPRSTVANLLRLAGLSEEVRELISQKKLTVKHGKLLAALPTSKAVRLAAEASDKRWSARRLEAAIKGKPRHAPKGRPETGLARVVPTQKNSDVLRLEQSLSEHIGALAEISYDANGAGELVLSFHNLEAFEGILEKLNFNSF